MAPTTRTRGGGRGRSTTARAVVLATKLYPPAERRSLVPRTELVAQLEAAVERKLTLISAPAGAGKTTLLGTWRAASLRGPRVAWLSLDAGDSDPVRFWTCVVESVRTVEQDVGAGVLALLRTEGRASDEELVAALVNDLAALGDRLILVLDDYHLVENAAIHAALGVLLEHLPATLRLVVAARSDPPLPLARLRVDGELAELRVADLRFSEKESAVLFNDVLGFDLEADDIGRLWGRTEGWPAGLYLAALSLADRPDRRDFIDAFAGDDRHVVDYFASEVLDRQPADVREFLVRTSILGRLCGPLCDFVLDRSGSAAMLRRLERSNLFLTPLDTRREWYRYHHLFADLLFHELSQAEPGLVPQLHRRASVWCRDHGFVPDAVRHALAGEDLPGASNLIALNWNDFVNHGRAETVARWLDSVPADAVQRDARLCLAQAGVHLVSGRRERVEPYLDAAEKASAPAGPRFGASTVEVEASIYRAANRFMTGDVGGALEPAGRAVELEHDESSPWHAMASAALGRTLFWSVRLTEAEAALVEAARSSQPGSNNVSVIGALGYLAALAAERGELSEADGLAHEALELAATYGFTEHWVCAMALLARGRVLEQEARLTEADEAATRALALARRGAVHVELVYGLVVLADVRRRLRDRSGARVLLREAREIVERCPDPGRLTDLVVRSERRLGAAPRAERSRVERRDDLSTRELAVLRLLPSERSLRDIGAALFVSYNTMKTHSRSIYRKLGASSRREAVERARELGLL